MSRSPSSGHPLMAQANRSGARLNENRFSPTVNAASQASEDDVMEERVRE